MITDERRDNLRRRYLSLGAGELVAAAVFTVIAIGLVTPRLPQPGDRLALWSGLIPLLLVLVQAGCYWLLARRWVGSGTMPRGLARLYRGFGTVNIVVLALGLAGLALWWPEDATAATLPLVAWVFGAIEFVNYFVVRLSYPLGSWPGSVIRWSRPRLVRDVRAALGVSRPR